MKDRLNKSTRNIGWMWIAISPIIFLMAAISTVESLTFYYAQLAVFSAVSFAAVAYGIAAVAGAPWASRGLLILSWLGCAYFFGAGILAVLFTLKRTLEVGIADSGFPFLIAILIAAPGVAFFLIARKIRANEQSHENP